jgi:D-threo-aldose 1-dehydrogenase
MSQNEPRRIGRSGVALSVFGFGAAPIGNLFAAVDEDSACEALVQALHAGIRHIDTAPYYGYGLSEQRVGRVLRTLMRETYTLSTKVGRIVSAGEAGAPACGDYVAAGRAQFDYTRGGVLRSIESSLSRLSVDRVDILLLHDVGAATHGARHEAMLQLALEEALPTMAELRDSGVCGAIGLGVNEEAVCLEILPRFDLDCILLAGRYSILDHASVHGLMAEALRRRIGVLVGGPYNSGLLASPEGPGSTYDYRPADQARLQRARELYALCENHGVDVGAVALHFPLAHPAVVSVVAGMRSPAEVATAVRRIGSAIPQVLWDRLRSAGFILPDAPTP